MPKKPILSRETFFSRIGGTNLGGDNAPQTLRRLEWNVVQTELGFMVEPCQQPGPDGTTPAVQIDANDVSFTAVRVLDNEGTFQNDFGTGGRTIPYDYGT